MIVAELILSVALVGGALLGLLGAVGLHRLPDVFTRMQAATKPPTLGLLLITLAVAARVSDADDAVKLALVAILQLLTSPVGAHMVARAAYRDGTLLSPLTQPDELADAGPPSAVAPPG